MEQEVQFVLKFIWKYQIPWRDHLIDFGKSHLFFCVVKNPLDINSIFPKVSWVSQETPQKVSKLGRRLKVKEMICVCSIFLWKELVCFQKGNQMWRKKVWTMVKKFKNPLTNIHQVRTGFLLPLQNLFSSPKN